MYKKRSKILHILYRMHEKRSHIYPLGIIVEIIQYSYTYIYFKMSAYSDSAIEIFIKM